MKIVVAGTCTLLSVAILAGFSLSAGDKDKKDDDKPKYTIKQVMAKAHGGDKKSLLFKIAGGKGEKKDAEQLLELYANLSKAEPPKGEPASWKKKTEEMVAAAKDVVAGKEGAEAKLQEAVDCKGCHSAHKPAKKKKDS